jgi:hypothetical protein
MGVVARREQRLSGATPVVVVLVCMRGVRGELIACIHHAAICRSVPHRIIGKGLWVEQQGMAGTGESIQLIVAEGLIPSAIRHASAIADRVIDVVGLVDGHVGRRELMQDIGHLTGGIVRCGHGVRFNELFLIDFFES